MTVLEDGDVGHEDAAADRVVERGAGRGGHDREVVQAAPGLVADVALDERAGAGIDGVWPERKISPPALTAWE